MLQTQLKLKTSYFFPIKGFFYGRGLCFFLMEALNHFPRSGSGIRSRLSRIRIRTLLQSEKQNSLEEKTLQSLSFVCVLLDLLTREIK
jgi:hypothetical protein